MLIKAAINGGRTKAEHPSIPVTPEEQAAAVVECLLKEAVNRGYGVRIGFEDTLHLSDDTPAQSNAELVAVALKLIRETPSHIA